MIYSNLWKFESIFFVLLTNSFFPIRDKKSWTFVFVILNLEQKKINSSEGWLYKYLIRSPKRLSEMHNASIKFNED